MFADRVREDRVLAAVRPGLLDAWLGRIRDNRLAARVAEAAARVFSRDKRLSFRLGRGKYLALSGVRHCRVRCVKGAVWVTASGDGRDRVLSAGESAVIVRGGKVVISGRGESCEVTVHWG